MKFKLLLLTLVCNTVYCNELYSVSISDNDKKIDLNVIQKNGYFYITSPQYIKMKINKEGFLTNYEKQKLGTGEPQIVNISKNQYIDDGVKYNRIIYYLNIYPIRRKLYSPTDAGEWPIIPFRYNNKNNGSVFVINAFGEGSEPKHMRYEYSPEKKRIVLSAIFEYSMGRTDDGDDIAYVDRFHLDFKKLPIYDLANYSRKEMSHFLFSYLLNKNMYEYFYKNSMKPVKYDKEKSYLYTKDNLRTYRWSSGHPPLPLLKNVKSLNPGSDKAKVQLSCGLDNGKIVTFYKDNNQIHYLYGTKDKIELRYPAKSNDTIHYSESDDSNKFTHRFDFDKGPYHYALIGDNYKVKPVYRSYKLVVTKGSKTIFNQYCSDKVYDSHFKY